MADLSFAQGCLDQFKKKIEEEGQEERMVAVVGWLCSAVVQATLLPTLAKYANPDIK